MRLLRFPVSACRIVMYDGTYLARLSSGKPRRATRQARIPSQGRPRQECHSGVAAGSHRLARQIGYVSLNITIRQTFPEGCAPEEEKARMTPQKSLLLRLILAGTAIP